MTTSPAPDGPVAASAQRGHGLSPDQVKEWALSFSRAQGLPDKVTDPQVYRTLAALMSPTPGSAKSNAAGGLQPVMPTAS